MSDHALQGWKTVNGHHLEKTYTFPDFVTALAFVNRVGAAAEEQAHHPDLLLGYGKVVVTTWSHDVDGITAKDHTLAAKCDQLYS